ncbi:hypothetical protein R9C00_21515 [Flammeovirgaceae bacterium SG7u.111]|nr:hypothetical protein [Flammeovirgaceae bacterium SG7u.132]WPO34281.1 hypothetical protein R9C00_21515 [Flammeovirgaceae bacterium SG7u.111]
MALLVEAPTNEYVSEASLDELVQQSDEWKADALFWREELKLFQRLLDHYYAVTTTKEEKKQISHLQSLITYYGGEVVYQIKHDVSQHRKHLIRLSKSGAPIPENDRSREEHKAYGEKMVSFLEELANIRQSLFGFITNLHK